MEKTATTTKRAPSRAELQTIEDIRDYVAEVLEGFEAEPLTRYGTGIPDEL